MPIKRAHMATFPAREHILEASLRSMEKQVDEIHLVLNEYSSVPGFLSGIRNLNPILPKEDLKDIGKFAAAPGPDDLVFLVDDDLCYSSSYCDWLMDRAAGLGLETAVFGLHGSIYRRRDVEHADDRKHLHYRRGLRRSLFVDQLGTGTVFASGRHVPPLDYMLGSQRFADVRYAKWCYENGVDQVALARPFGMIRPLRHRTGKIYRDFTATSPEPVLAEIRTFAGRSSRVGEAVGERIGLKDLLLGA